MIRWILFVGISLAISLPLILTGISLHDSEVKDAEARGIVEGQCSQMRWDIGTGALKPMDERITRSVYADWCKGKPKP